MDKILKMMRSTRFYLIGVPCFSRITSTLQPCQVEFSWSNSDAILGNNSRDLLSSIGSPNQEKPQQLDVAPSIKTINSQKHWDRPLEKNESIAIRRLNLTFRAICRFREFAKLLVLEGRATRAPFVGKLRFQRSVAQKSLLLLPLSAWGTVR